MVTRRNEPRLLADLTRATGKSTKAHAHLALATFHDNNSRESLAIPHYMQALKSGLPPKQKMEATAWLASSYWKTGQPTLALATISKIERGRDHPELREWIQRLQKRIKAAPDRFVR